MDKTITENQTETFEIASMTKPELVGLALELQYENNLLKTIMQIKNLTEKDISIIRQSSAKTGMDFAAKKDLKSSDGLALAKRIEEYVITGQ